MLVENVAPFPEGFLEIKIVVVETAVICFNGKKRLRTEGWFRSGYAQLQLAFNSGFTDFSCQNVSFRRIVFPE